MNALKSHCKRIERPKKRKGWGVGGGGWGSQRSGRDWGDQRTGGGKRKNDPKVGCFVGTGSLGILLAGVGKSLNQGCTGSATKAYNQHDQEGAGKKKKLCGPREKTGTLLQKNRRFQRRKERPVSLQRTSKKRSKGGARTYKNDQAYTSKGEQAARRKGTKTGRVCWGENPVRTSAA